MENPNTNGAQTLIDLYRPLLMESRYKHYPCIGIFYGMGGELVAPDFCLWPVDPDVSMVLPEYTGLRFEHRDLWDAFIKPNHPDWAKEYDDDHKSMPRGRVGLVSPSGRTDPEFEVTLCPCLNNEAFRDQILQRFNLRGFDVRFLPGTMNYLCRDCR